MVHRTALAPRVAASAWLNVADARVDQITGGNFERPLRVEIWAANPQDGDAHQLEAVSFCNLDQLLQQGAVLHIADGAKSVVSCVHIEYFNVRHQPSFVDYIQVIPRY